MEVFSLALLNLKDAMHQEGCPLCRSFLRAETGFMRSLLWENVNDVGTRVRLAESLGACGRHRATAAANGDCPGGMCLSAIVSSMKGSRGNVALRLRGSALARRKTGAARLDAQASGASSGTERHTERLDRLLTPENGCRVCEIAEESVRFHAETLLEMMAYPEYQGWYEHSEGVCLCHLRLLLQVAPLGPGLDYLLAQSQQRIDALGTDLREYTRKQSYQFHHEPVSEGERKAVARALAFFGGLDAATSVGIEERYKEETSGAERSLIMDW